MYSEANLSLRNVFCLGRKRLLIVSYRFFIFYSSILPIEAFILKSEIGGCVFEDSSLWKTFSCEGS